MKQKRSDVLNFLSLLLSKNRKEILEVNNQDKQTCPNDDSSLLDRLKVNDDKIDDMIQSLITTALAENPDEKVIYEFVNPDDLVFKNITVPFGNILIIYESRPDVTIEAAAMAFKSGNKILLKGGKEAKNTNLFLVKLWHEALNEFGFSTDMIQYLDLTRQEIQDLISSANNNLDLIIPRGGDSLIKFVTDHSKVPVIVSGRGNNFIFIDRTADIKMAKDIIVNGKSRISVCNATDKVLIDQHIPDIHSIMDELILVLIKNNIDIIGDETMTAYSDHMQIISDESIMYEEFLSSKILLSQVNGLNDAIHIINKYSGGHSASIITKNADSAAKFMNEVDCAAVYHNASTRFTDGGQVGFGGEMAISTQKLHFRGPIGTSQLVTNKWFVFGDGHCRT
jgi:glutamate-5-semialdehyde dehydrogenase